MSKSPIQEKRILVCSFLITISARLDLMVTMLIAILFSFTAMGQDVGRVVSHDPRLEAIIDQDAVVEKVADGFKFTEGPVWFNDGHYLLFSDIPQNKIFKWDANSDKVSVYLEKSGFTGDDPAGIGREVNEGTEIFYNLGSNGVTKDAQGRIVFNAMGDRAIVRLEHDGSRTVLASHYQGKRLNSTNDLVYNSKGWLYFTDPPSGLRGGHDDPDMQLDYSGVFMLKDSGLHLLTRHVYHPNGLTFSPDGRYLFVNDNRARKIYRFDLEEDGTIFNMQVFVDMTDHPGIGNPDGMKFDTEGNMYAAGADGIWVVSPAGEHLGTIEFPERASNMTFGGDEARTLYVSARTSIYRVRVNIPGIRP